MGDKRAAVETFIADVRQRTDRAVERYTQGDCYKLHLMLREAFPQAKPWYDQVECHVLTELYGRLYDITGWVWSINKEPPHVVPWEQVEERVRLEAPHWGWVAPRLG